MSVHQLKTVQRLKPYDGDVWERADLSFRARAVYVYLSRFQGLLPLVAEVEAMTGLGRDARRAVYAELRSVGLLETGVGTFSALSKGGAE